MGGQIVAHSFRLLFRNLVDALKISVGPFLIGILACVAIFYAAGSAAFALLESGFQDLSAIEQDPAIAGGILLAILVCAAILLFISSWVAVAWHRFVLLEEYPGLLPALSGRPVGPYLGRAVLLTLIILLIAIPVSIVGGLLLMPAAIAGGSAAGIWALIVGIGVSTVITYISIRFGLALPAVAVGRPISFGTSWRLTVSHANTILVAVLILTALNIVVAGLLQLVLGGGIIALILELIVNWISVMLGISILTTLYGHIVEGRTID